MSESPITTLPEARRALAGARIWLVTDGKAGDIAHCRGLVDRLGLDAEARIVAPRAPFVWGMPHLWRWPGIGIDPREAPGRESGPLAGPLPDLVIASGRRAAAYLPAIKRASGGRTFTVFLKDPRAGAALADFLWVPAHDPLRGPRVMTTLLSPHRFSPELLAAHTARAHPHIDALPAPRVTLLIGGESRHFTFTPADLDRFGTALTALAASGAGLMATLSRRTPPALRAVTAEIVAAAGGWLWDGTGENPYPDFLARAEAFVITMDSVNMLGEAAATGRGVFVFRPSGGAPRLDQFLRELEAAGVTRPFTGRVEPFTYPPMDATPAIAIELARRFIEARQRETAA